MKFKWSLSERKKKSVAENFLALSNRQFVGSQALLCAKHLKFSVERGCVDCLFAPWLSFVIQWLPL